MTYILLLIPCPFRRASFYSHACDILELNCGKAEGSYGSIGLDGLDVVVSLQCVRYLLNQLVDKSTIVPPTASTEASTPEQLVVGSQESPGEEVGSQEEQLANPVAEKVGIDIGEPITIDTKAA